MTIKLLAGVAKGDITPGAGIQLTGFLSRKEKPSRGIHDRLFARALFFKKKKRKFLIVNLDLLGVGKEYSDIIRREIGKKFSLRESEVVIVATHTHSAPAAICLEECGKINPGYIRFLRRHILETVEAAIKDVSPVKVGIEKVKIKNASYNRRKILENGFVSMSMNPANKVIKSGPVDNDFFLIKIEDDDVKAIILNFAAHPCAVCDNNITADYPGILCRKTEKFFPGAAAFFFTGACGNINPVFSKMNYSEMVKNANNLFGQIKNTISSVKTKYLKEFEIKRALITLFPQKTRTDSEIQKQLSGFLKISNGNFSAPEAQNSITVLRNILNIEPGKPIGKKQAEFAARAMACIYRKNLKRVVEKIPFEINMLKLGNIYIVFLNAEIFCETASAIKKYFKNKKIVITGYANGVIGYLPTREAFREGGYEVEYAYRFYGYPLPLKENSEERVISMIKKMI